MSSPQGVLPGRSSQEFHVSFTSISHKNGKAEVTWEFKGKCINLPSGKIQKKKRHKNSHINLNNLIREVLESG